ncbi:MAG TPA: arylsulfotransferase family protein [Halococcus sp.]|nr:arylsulfotransferase family protein [Halococcus sp.]
MTRQTVLGFLFVTLVVLAGCNAVSPGANTTAQSTTAGHGMQTTDTQTATAATTPMQSTSPPDSIPQATRTATTHTTARRTATATQTATPRPTNTADRRGRTVVGIQAGSEVVMVDAGGETLWSYGNVTGYFDVTVLDNGNVLAAIVLDDQRACGTFTPPCGRTGFRIIDPTPTPHVVYQWTYPIRDTLNSEVHDVNPLPGDRFLLTGMEYERIFIVARNGTVLWQWNASRRYDAPPDPTKTDWLHINDVDRIRPGRYLVSVRNANQLLIIERGKGVVEVINEDRNDSDDADCTPSGAWGQLGDYDNDGDVLCGDPSLFDHQHNPQYLGPGAVLVADSENDRVVELHKNDGPWRVAWALDSAGGIPFNWSRDADRLPNGHTLITDSKNDRVVEVTKQGQVVWSLNTSHWPYEADRLPYGEQTGEPYNTSADSVR